MWIAFHIPPPAAALNPSPPKDKTENALKRKGKHLVLVSLDNVERKLSGVICIWQGWLLLLS